MTLVFDALEVDETYVEILTLRPASRRRRSSSITCLRKPVYAFADTQLTVRKCGTRSKCLRLFVTSTQS